jgi:FdhE protein
MAKKTRIDKLVEEKVKKFPETASFLSFYVKLRKKQSALTASITRPASYQKEEARKRLAAGMPIFKTDEWQIKAGEAEKIVVGLCRFIERVNPDIKERMKPIRGAFEEKRIKAKPFVEEGLRKHDAFIEALSEKLDLDFHLLYLLARSAAKPYLLAVRKDIGAWVDEMPRREPGCPVCGSDPVMAELREEEGYRHFYCAFCRHEWSWKRIDCPFCRNQDGEKLRYFYLESDKAYRVNVCLACKRYIKTVDSREFALKPVLDIEAAGTLHLDIKAECEGYERPFPIEAMFV